MRRVLIVLSMLTLSPWLAHAAIHNVANNTQLSTAISQANCGDEIILADGAYSGSYTLTDQCTPTTKITIRAQNTMKAIFTNSNACTSATRAFVANGADYWVIDGLKFVNYHKAFEDTSTSHHIEIRNFIISPYQHMGIRLHGQSHYVHHGVIAYGQNCGSFENQPAIYIGEESADNNVVEDVIIFATGDLGYIPKNPKKGYAVTINDGPDNNILRGLTMFDDGQKGGHRVFSGTGGLRTVGNVLRDSIVAYGEGTTSSSDCEDHQSHFINNLIVGEYYASLSMKGAPDANTGQSVIEHNTIILDQFGRNGLRLHHGDAGQGCQGVKTELTFRSNLIYASLAFTAATNNFGLIDSDGTQAETFAVRGHNLLWAPGAQSTWMGGYTPQGTDLLQQPTFVNAVEGDFSLAAGSPGKANGHDGTDRGIRWNAFLKKGHAKRIFALPTAEVTPASTAASFAVDATAFYQVRFKVPPSISGCTGIVNFTVEGTSLPRDMSLLTNGQWVQGSRAWIALGRHRATDGVLNVSFPHANCADGIYIRKLPSADEAWTWVVQPDPVGSLPVPEGATAVVQDVEQNLTTGNVTLSGQEIEIGEQTNGTPAAVAVRLTNLNVPQGATCTSALLSMQATDTATHSLGSPTFAIDAVDSINAPVFVDVDNEITSLTLLGSPVTWSPATWTQNAITAASTTPNLCTLLQPLFDHVSWNPASNAVTFVLVHASGSDGYRIAKSLEAGGTAYLTVTTSEDPPPEGTTFTVAGLPNDAEENLLSGNVTLNGLTMELGQQVSGTPNAVFLRLQNLSVPQGSVCQQAAITFTAADALDISAGSPTFLVKAVEAITLPELVDVDSAISALITGSAEVSWSPAPWTQNTANLASTTPNLCTILQPLFDNPAWDSQANAIGIIVVHAAGSSGYRIAKSVDAGGLTTLALDYEAGQTGSPVLSLEAWQSARADSPQDAHHWLNGLNGDVSMPSPSCVDVRMRVGVTGGGIGPVVLAPVWRLNGTGPWAPLAADHLQALALGQNLQVANGTATLNLLGSPSFVAGRYMTAIPGAPFLPVTLADGQTTELATTACLTGNQIPPTFFELCLANGGQVISCPNPPRINIGGGIAFFKG